MWQGLLSYHTLEMPTCCMCVCVCMSACVHAAGVAVLPHAGNADQLYVFMCVNIYIYIYIYIERERERDCCAWHQQTVSCRIRYGYVRLLSAEMNTHTHTTIAIRAAGRPRKLQLGYAMCARSHFRFTHVYASIQHFFVPAERVWCMKWGRGGQEVCAVSLVEATF
jgi:hypothetical protein